jgi:hypothetical protein
MIFSKSFFENFAFYGLDMEPEPERGKSRNRNRNFSKVGTGTAKHCLALRVLQLMDAGEGGGEICY